MPSDYRYDPFNNIAEPVPITGETHIIPTNSPFTIRLAEVPLKESPSTVSLTINGVAGVEVAAEPAAGQFRCDYTTGADSDDNWNTGTILFNAADAGKTVVVAYNGIGTLASVNSALTLPSWAKYRGDGSDGDFTAAGGEILSGVKQYASFTIGAGLTVNVGADPLLILCQGDVLIDGTLNGAGGLGNTSSSGTAAGGTGTGGGGNGGSSSGELPINGSGGGGGGNGRVQAEIVAGGTSNFANYLVAAAGSTPSSVFQSLMAQTLNQLNAGAGGGGGDNLNSSAAGAGGGGGGTIILAGETVSNNGTLNVAGGLKSTATGSNNNRAAGGGGGGAAIVIIAKNIIIAGTINVAGGAGGLSKYSAGNSNGGAGWYKIFTAGA